MSAIASAHLLESMEHTVTDFQRVMICDGVAQADAVGPELVAHSDDAGETRWYSSANLTRHCLAFQCII